MSQIATEVIFQNYLHFNGNAKEAFERYQSIFGGELSLIPWAAAPPEAQREDVPGDRIMHARLGVGENAFMGCDTPSVNYEAPQGFRVSISLTGEDAGRRIFDALADGGEIVMPYQATFWASGFGMVNDRFGTPWMINCEGPHEPG